ncbi:hypothetical protein ACHAXN_001081 [Cyclotella atomus]
MPAAGYGTLGALSIHPSSDQMITNDSIDASDGLVTESARPTKSITMPSQQNNKTPPYSLIPSPLFRLIRDLLACQQVNDTFQSDAATIPLDSAIGDLRMLLSRPGQFLSGANQELPTVTIMYGRSSESFALLDAFRRFASNGQSEALFVKGFSGSGETRLVQSMLGVVTIANGLVIKRKFEKNSTNQLSLVLFAFNEVSQRSTDLFALKASSYLVHLKITNTIHKQICLQLAATLQ